MSTEYTRAVIDNGPIKLMDDVRVNSPLRVLACTLTSISIFYLFADPDFNHFLLSKFFFF